MYRRIVVFPAFLILLQLVSLAETPASLRWKKPEGVSFTAGRAAVDSRNQRRPASAVAVDPTGDTFGAGPVFHDIVQFSAIKDSPNLVISLSFAGPIIPADSGNPDALVGLIDLDTDQDTSTGTGGGVGSFCPMPPAIGSDYFVDLFSYSSATGQANLYDITSIVGQVSVIFQAQSLTVTIPLLLLSDDGSVNTATVVGTFIEPTDCAPNGQQALESNPHAVPTLSQWGILLMGGLLLGLGSYLLRS